MRSVAAALAAMALTTVAARADVSPSGFSLLEAAQTAEFAQRSVHDDYRWFMGGNQVWHVVTDAGHGLGIQRVTFTRGGETGNVTIVETHGVAFVRGNATALHTELGFRKGASTTQAGHWIRIRSTEPSFQRITQDVALESLADELDMETEEPNTIPGLKDGFRVREVIGRSQGPGAGEARLWVRAAPGHLPVLFVKYNHARTGHSVERFTHWNEHLDVRAPAGWVDISKTGLA